MPERLRAIFAHARALAGAGNLKDAAARYGDAVEKARAFQLSGELAFALRHQAECMIGMGEGKAAYESSLEAAAIYDRMEPQRGLNYANCARLVALSLEMVDRREEALAYWNAARDIFDLLGIAANVAECDAHLTR